MLHYFKDDQDGYWACNDGGNFMCCVITQDGLHSINSGQSDNILADLRIAGEPSTEQEFEENLSKTWAGFEANWPFGPVTIESSIKKAFYEAQ